MILAKLLLPEERGVLVIILPLVVFFETFTEIGVKHSVIQNKDGAMDSYLNMAWWIQGVRSALLYLIAFLVSPLLCHIWVYGKSEIVEIYSRTELLWMLRITFLNILFNGFISPRVFVLIKNFKFGQMAVLAQGSMILGNVVTIILVFWWRNVWAFVIGSASSYFFQTAFSYLMCPFRPRMRYDRKSFKALFHFSKGMFGLPMMTYFALNIDVLVGSLFLSPALIGMYGFAVGLARTPREILSRIIGPLLIPAFSEKQDHHESVCRGIYYITKLLAIVSMPLVVFCVLESKTILSVIFKPEFVEVAVPFCLLCATFMILLLAIPLSKVFFGLGRPEMQRRCTIVRLAILGLLIWPAVKYYELVGISILLAGANTVMVFCQLFFLKQLISLNLRHYGRSLIPGAVTSVGYFLTVLIISKVTSMSDGLCLWVNLALLGLFTVAALGLIVVKPEIDKRRTGGKEELSVRDE
jgi:O-antigen/teichoic acid export membrane protein